MRLYFQRTINNIHFPGDARLTNIKSPAPTIEIPPLRKSLFSHVPPSINFPDLVYTKLSQELPKCVKKYNHWEMRPSSFGPPKFKNSVSQAGFEVTAGKNCEDCTAYW